MLQQGVGGDGDDDDGDDGDHHDDDFVQGTGCCSKVLVASTGQARVDQALYMGIYAR